MTFERMSRFGLAEISFDNLLNVPPNWTQMDDAVLNIQVEPYDVELLVLKELTWSIVDFQSTGMTIQVYFRDPQYISDDVKGKD